MNPIHVTTRKPLKLAGGLRFKLDTYPRPDSESEGDLAREARITPDGWLVAVGCVSVPAGHGLALHPDEATASFPPSLWVESFLEPVPCASKHEKLMPLIIPARKEPWDELCPDDVKATTIEKIRAKYPVGFARFVKFAEDSNIPVLIEQSSELCRYYCRLIETVEALRAAEAVRTSSPFGERRAPELPIVQDRMRLTEGRMRQAKEEATITARKRQTEALSGK